MNLARDERCGPGLYAAWDQVYDTAQCITCSAVLPSTTSVTTTAWPLPCGTRSNRTVCRASTPRSVILRLEAVGRWEEPWVEVVGKHRDIRVEDRRMLIR